MAAISRNKRKSLPALQHWRVLSSLLTWCKQYTENDQENVVHGLSGVQIWHWLVKMIQVTLLEKYRIVVSVSIWTPF